MRESPIPPGWSHAAMLSVVPGVARTAAAVPDELAAGVFSAACSGAAVAGACATGGMGAAADGAGGTGRLVAFDASTVRTGDS